jgi:hypothetical protein
MVMRRLANLLLFGIVMTVQPLAAQSAKDDYRLLDPDKRLDGSEPPSRYRLLDPNERLDGSDAASRYRFLDPNQRFIPGVPTGGRYWLLNDSQIGYFDQKRQQMNEYEVGVFDRIKLLKQIDSYSEGEVRWALMLARLYFPSLPTTSLSILQYLKMGADEFQKLTEEKRQLEFCRYRIAIYRRDGIMYPQECWK